MDIPAKLNVPYRERNGKEIDKGIQSKNSVKGTDATKLDIFGTDLAKTAPIFVYFSGGYWQVNFDLILYIKHRHYNPPTNNFNNILHIKLKSSSISVIMWRIILLSRWSTAPQQYCLYHR